MKGSRQDKPAAACRRLLFVCCLGNAVATTVPPPLLPTPQLNRTLYVFVHIDKTGSSSMRNTLRSLQNHTAANNPRTPHWLCDVRLALQSTGAAVGINSCGPAAEVVIGAAYGSCERLRVARPCRYFVVLREPVARVVSAYNYFCLRCSESAKFCAKNSGTNCPRESFWNWTRYAPNEYTRHFSSTSIGFYMKKLNGFQGLPPISAEDYERAHSALTSPNMLTLRTDTLDVRGWVMLAELWSDRPMGVALRHRLGNGTALPHNNVGGKSTFSPTAHQVLQTCKFDALAWDCRLYRELASRLVY